MTTKTNTRGSTSEARPALRDISWSQFLELPGLTKAIRRNVFRTEDEQTEYLTKASQRFLARHGVNRVYAPGACPL